MSGFESLRPLIVSVEGADEVRVALEWEAELFVGQAAVAGDGAVDRDCARLEAGARATLAALGSLTPSAVVFSLEWAARVATGDALPAVVASMPRVEVAGVPMRYAGAVVDDGADPALLAARATMDALNRRLGVSGL